MKRIVAVWTMAPCLVLAACWAPGSTPLATMVRAGVEWPTPASLRSVAQAAADAGALAGAASFLEAHDDGDRARDAALKLISVNEEAHPRVTLEATRIDVDLAAGRIQVELQAQGHRFPGALARRAGFGDLSVSVSAAAEAQDVRCTPAGTSPDGYPMERCEGQAKYLRLISLWSRPTTR